MISVKHITIAGCKKEKAKQKTDAFCVLSALKNTSLTHHAVFLGVFDDVIILDNVREDCEYFCFLRWFAINRTAR